MIVNSLPDVKNIIHVIGHLDNRIGGPRASLLTLVKSTCDGHKISHSIICQFDTNQECESFEKELGKPVLRVKSGFFAPWHYWCALSKNRKHTTNLIIHIHGIFGWYPTLTAVFARLYRIRSVLSPRGMTIRLQGTSQRLSLKRFVVILLNRLMASFGLIHATSDHEYELLTQQFNYCRLIKVSSANFDFIMHSPPIYKPAERPYFIYLGRISSSKNVDSLIDAWLSLKETQDCKLLLTGPLDKEFPLSEIELLELKSSGIIYQGPVYDEAKKIELFNKSRYLINFSVSENFGHSIFEALCLGVPVVVSSATPWNQVELSGAGMVFDPWDADFKSILDRCVGFTDHELLSASQAARLFINEYGTKNKSNTSALYEFSHV